MTRVRLSFSGRSMRRVTAIVLATILGVAGTLVPAASAQASSPPGPFAFHTSYSQGAFNVDRTRTYVLFGTSDHRPRYIDAAPYPQHPSGADYYFHRAGRSGGHPSWELRVRITANLRSHRYWNVGVRTGHTVHRLKIRVLGRNDSRGLQITPAGSTHQG